MSLPRPLRVTLRLAALLLATATACAPTPKPDGPSTTPPAGPPPTATSAATSPVCPARAPAPSPLPGVAADQETLAYWLGRTPDAVLMTPEDVARHNAALARPGGPDTAGDVFATVAKTGPEAIRAELRDRLAYLRGKIAAKEYVDQNGLSPPPTLFADMALAEGRDELRVALGPIGTRCGPMAAGLYTSPPNPAFDRNLCSTVPAQEPVRVVARLDTDWLVLHTRAGLGLVPVDAPLSPVVPENLVAALQQGPFVTLGEAGKLEQSGGATTELPQGTRLPVAGANSVWLATATGFVEAHPAGSTRLSPTARPLTRHSFLTEAFARFGQPYGWGGAGGGRDCSQFVQEVLNTFGLDLPRNSGQQALAGAFSVDLSQVTAEADRLALLDAAQARGLVLLHLPGHIMIYLGRDAAGRPMALHAFAEYLEPCPGGGETLREVSRIGGSTLELGRGTSRRSFIERLVRLTVFGPVEAPRGAGGDPLAGAVDLRPAAPPAFDACPDSTLAGALFVSPAKPRAGAPVRLVGLSNADPGPATVWVVGPDGAPLDLPNAVLGGPPFGRVATLATPGPGTYTARFADGDRVLACRHFAVAPTGKAPHETPDVNLYTPHRAWDATTEGLFALFVESLFNYPLADDLTWPNLQVLLQNPDHNLLLNYLGLDEDAALKLQPDCADLPYMLRAYFAWKLRLPFGYRACSKGRAGHPPQCGPVETSMQPRDGRSEVAAFDYFANRLVRPTAHSASGRTHPDDSETDLYPVPLTREALRPGTVFADPYGHLLVIAQWLPQRPGTPGTLIGAEAQPDGTIGRRRFWRGSFLFRPETTSVGAGFKAWRPVRQSRGEGGGGGGTLDNAALAHPSLTDGFAPYSRQQYAGDMDAFYDAVEAVESPRPLEPMAAVDALVADLEESAVRRTISVQNGEDFQRDHPQVVPMPAGPAIFQTKGAWEDYSTPSRDFRLLIALDTVQGFPEAIRRRPERFGVPPWDAAALQRVVDAVRTRLAAKLAERRFDYTRSDGSRFSLSLADLAPRAAGFEVSYNPNDCPEVRWAAPAGSAEAATCIRHAPAAQRTRMEAMRRWFHTRTRPTE